MLTLAAVADDDEDLDDQSKMKTSIVPDGVSIEDPVRMYLKRLVKYLFLCSQENILSCRCLKIRLQIPYRRSVPAICSLIWLAPHPVYIPGIDSLIQRFFQFFFCVTHSIKRLRIGSLFYTFGYVITSF